MSLPRVEDVSDFYRVTSWSRLDNKWEGVRFMDIANHCEIFYSKVHNIKTYDAYGINVHLKKQSNRMFYWFINLEGTPLITDHGGPVRMTTTALPERRKMYWSN